MLEWLGPSQLVDLIAIGIALAGGAWLISNSISSLGQSVARLDERVNALDKRVDALDKRMSDLDKRMDALDKRVDALDKRMSDLFLVVSRIEWHLSGNKPALVEEGTLS